MPKKKQEPPRLYETGCRACGWPNVVATDEVGGDTVLCSACAAVDCEPTRTTVAELTVAEFAAVVRAAAAQARGLDDPLLATQT